LPFVEFAYNITVYSTASFSPFKIIYGFNPLTPMDLIPLSFEERVSLDGENKAKMVRQLNEGVQLQIEKKNRLYASKANKGCKQVVFQPDDGVWVHMHKERFPNQRKSKLQPSGDSPFQVLERINDNAYKIDLPRKYDVSATFNVADLTLFDTCFDSRLNPFEERGDDVNQPKNTSKDPLHVPNGPRRIERGIECIGFEGFDQVRMKGPLEYQEEALVHLIHV
jgi:hypothetical protein